MSSSLGSVALGLAALAGAAAIGALAPRMDRDRTTAALGGLSTIYVDTLFLRAEGLRREGRFDEIPALYRRILEAAPDSETAIDYLADVLGNDLRELGTSPASRLAWWDEADALLARALERRPDAARLLFRRAQLRLVPGADDAAVREGLRARGRDAELEAFRFLADAVERSASLGRAGRAHLVAFARVAPRLAAERLTTGSASADEVLGRGEGVLRLRADDFADFTLDDVAGGLSAGDRLYGGLGIVRAIRDRLGRRPPDRDGARALLAAYRSAVGDDAVARTLAERLR